jgi:hypothetical protein
MYLCEAKLDEDEDAHGLASDQVTGALHSRELADEQAKRRLS